MLGRRRNFHLSLRFFPSIALYISLTLNHFPFTIAITSFKMSTMNEYDNRQYDVIVWGASGYTGALTAEHIARSFPTNIKWAVAGRSAGKLQAVVEKCKRINPDRPQPCKQDFNSQIVLSAPAHKLPKYRCSIIHQLTFDIRMLHYAVYID